MEKEGLKQILIPESCYNKLLDRVKEAKEQPLAKPKPAGEWCLTIIIQEPGGEQHTVCLGSCAWYKQIFGGDCVSTKGGGCYCSWGILDPIINIFG